MSKPVKDHLGDKYANEREMCEAHGISYSVFYQRYHVNGWSMEDALTVPLRGKRKSDKERVEKSANRSVKEDGFGVTSNYPSEEYVKFLKNRKRILEQNSKNFFGEYTLHILKKAIADLDKLIDRLSADALHYTVMDKIYAGEEEKARQICSESEFQSCVFTLNNPSGMEEEIYVEFAKKFNMQKKSSI